MRGSLLIVAWLVACAETSRTGTPDATSTVPVELSSIRRLPVDSLSESQAKALCRASAEEDDFCMQRGQVETTEASCVEVVASCRSNLDGGSTPVDCNRYDLGPPGSCSVTVDEYLACASAWHAAQTCKNAGHFIDTPGACTSVVTKCPQLASAFTRNGIPPPCVPDASAPTRAGDDFYGFDGCRPTPSRFVILGDSIASCYAVDPAHCGPLLIGDYVKTNFAPNLTVTSYAVSGATLADLPAQAQNVSSGPGHVVVWIYILGNDIVLRHVDYDAWGNDWNATFAYFTDKSRFPDGVTFLLNTQYGIYDQCPHPVGGGFSASAEAQRLLESVNKNVFIDLAIERSDTVTIDQYPDWLGHGDNANVRGCPYCGKDNATWMASDRIHPNDLGNAHIAAKWKSVLERLFGPACHSG